MVIVEFKDAAYDKAFELLDEAKHYTKKTKMTLCALEDAVSECYEASKDDEHDEEDGYSEEETELGLRRGRRSGMRHDEGEDWDMSHRRSRGMRMRRNRMGRYY